MANEKNNKITKMTSEQPGPHGDRILENVKNLGVRSSADILMTYACHYKDLTSASDWLKQISRQSEPVSIR